MRTILTPNMLEVLARNYSRKIDKAKAFEIGNTFIANMVNSDDLPEEQYSLCIGMYGEGEDFYGLKGVLEELFRIMGVKDVVFTAESQYGVYHPGRCARIAVPSVRGGDGDPVLYDELGIIGRDTSGCCRELRHGRR